MRRFTTTSLALSLVVAVGTAVPATAKDRDLTFYASLSGADTMTDDDPGYIAARCVEIGPREADWVTTLAGTGHAGRLGRVDMAATYCVDADTGAYGDGVFTLTAANGDVLRGVFSEGTSRLVDPDEPWRVEYEDSYDFVDGGTGRFATATGSGAEVGRFDALTGGWSLEISGTIQHSRR
jgi:hypothetical protein